MAEEMAKRRKVAVNGLAPTCSKAERAVTLLYSDYETRLDDDSFVRAIDFVENESKASIFLVMKPGNKRDRWLGLHINVELEPIITE